MQWNNRKKEYWEMNKHPIQIWVINQRIKWRKFNTNTKGFGFLIIILFVAMGFMAITSIAPTITSISHQDQLKKVCKDKDFYYLNFNSCEGADARPTVITPVNNTK